jgi:hypothetical protein
MQLTYRGVTYEYNPPVVEAVTGTVGGKYRGLDWRFRNLKKPPILQPRVNLTYRGVRYNQPALDKVAPEIPTVASAQEKARTLMMQQTRAIKKRQQSLLSRSATEIGLAAQVSDYWNHIQGKVHPTFRMTYSRSAATVS